MQSITILWVVEVIVLLKTKLFTMSDLLLINFIKVLVQTKSGHFSSKFYAHFTKTLRTAQALNDFFPSFMT